MNKKNLIGMIALIVVFAIITTVVVVSIKKDREIYVDDAGIEHLLVLDEEGNTTLSKSGDIVVYATDTHGDIILDENGDPQYRYVKFPNLVIKDNTLETPTYKLTMPKDWVLEENGTFHLKDNEDVTLTITKMCEYNGTVEEYIIENKELSDQVLKEIEKDYSKLETTESVCLLTMKSINCFVKDYKAMQGDQIEIYTKAIYFVENEEVYKISFICQNGSYDETIDILNILDNNFSTKTITKDY